MIRNDEEYERARTYVEGLQRLLMEMRRTHTPSQYEWMSKSFIKELAKAQREITFYLAQPVAPEQRAA